MAISVEVYEKMPPEIRALVQRAPNSGKDSVVALFPVTSGGGDTRGKGTGSRPAGFGNVGSAPGSDGGPAGQTYADSGSAARFFNSFPSDEMPWPLAFYHAKAGKTDRAGSRHPTVKPIGLMRHLIRHITPPGGTVLDPFAGSGTTAVAALAEGMNCILMEAEPEYNEFLRKRFNLNRHDEWAEMLGLSD